MNSICVIEKGYVILLGYCPIEEKMQREGHRNLSRIGGRSERGLEFLCLIIKFKIEGRCRL
jgi:hypothetical protein